MSVKVRIGNPGVSGAAASSASGGCGCVSLVIAILLFWSMFFGLPVGDKKWNIDIFPPRIWDMYDGKNQPSMEAEPIPVKVNEAEKTN